LNCQVKDDDTRRVCSTDVEEECIQNIGGKAITLGRPRRKWVNNIKMDLREVGLGGMDWNELAQNRDRWSALVNTIDLQIP
jgi:hypothetical protein